jgi:hypothetical protein
MSNLRPYGEYTPVCSWLVSAYIFQNRFLTTALLVVRTQVRQVRRVASHRRFDRSHDFSLLFGSSDEQFEYLQGFVVGGSLLAGFFIAWAVAIFVLSCFKHRVGFWGGAPFVVRLSPEEYDNSFKDGTISPEPPSSRHSGDDVADNGADEDAREASKQTMRQTPRPRALFPRRPTIVRCIFLMLYVVFILFAVLLATKGLNNLSSTVFAVRKSASDVNQIAKDVNRLISKTLEAVSAVVVEVRDQVLEELDRGPVSFCPEAPEKVTANGIVASVFNRSREVVNLLQDFKGFNDDDEITAAINDIAKSAAKLKEKTYRFNTKTWYFGLVMGVATVVPSVLMAATVMAMYDVTLPWLTPLLDFVVLPLFMVIVTAMMAVATCILIASGMNGDFCLPGGFVADPLDQSILAALTNETAPYVADSPDLSVLRVLSRQGIQGDVLTFQAVVFYIQQCREGADPFERVRDYNDELVSELPPAVDLSLTSPVLLRFLTC